MIVVFVIIVAIVLIATYKIREVLNNKHLLVLLLSLKKYESDFKNATADFQNLVNGNWYISDRQYREWKAKYKYLAEILNPFFSKIKTKEPFKKLVVDFDGFWHNCCCRPLPPYIWRIPKAV